MRKWFYIVPVAFILLMGTFAVLINFNKQELNFSDFLVESTDLFILVKADKILNNKKELRELDKIGGKVKSILAAGDINIDMKQLSIVKKYIKTFFLIHQTEIYEDEEIAFNPETLIVGADTGIFYPIAKIVMGSYFKREKNDIFFMRHKNRQNKAEEMPDKDIFMIEYKKIFVFSYSKESIREYQKSLVSGEKHKEFADEYNQMKSKYIVMAGDLSSISGSLLEGNKLLSKIKDFKATFEYDSIDRKFTANISLNGEGDVFHLMENRAKSNQALKDYMDKDDVYFRNKNMREVLAYYLDMLSNGREDYRKKIYEVFGYDVYEAADLLDKEIVFKQTDNGLAFIAQLKNGNKAKNYLIKQGFNEKNGIFNILGRDLMIKDNLCFFNIETYTPFANNIYIRESSFVYSNMNIGRFRGAEYFRGVYAEAEATADKNNINLKLMMTKSDMSEFLTRVIEVMN